ncbi:MAG: thioesterase family protein [Lachnospiraceae bacterium]|nr:thioesterase family protein [Lachnospiraceae bacterium]
MLKTGIKGYQSVLSTEERSAKVLGSGTLEVFATPAMVALMEKTAQDSVASYLEEGDGTVGIRLDITHDAPTPLGMQVYCESELIEIDGRRLVFQVDAYDETGKIGSGRHERFIIHNEKFQEKADKKRELPKTGQV